VAQESQVVKVVEDNNSVIVLEQEKFTNLSSLLEHSEKDSMRKRSVRNRTGRFKSLRLAESTLYDSTSHPTLQK
jgi:hypothetical protein